MKKYRVKQNRVKQKVFLKYGVSFQYKVQRNFFILGFITIKTFYFKEQAMEYYKYKLKSKQERIECIGERI